MINAIQSINHNTTEYVNIEQLCHLFLIKTFSWLTKMIHVTCYCSDIYLFFVPVLTDLHGDDVYESPKTILVNCI